MDPLPIARISRAINFTFGEGQAEGIDNVAVTVTVDVPDPFGGAPRSVTESRYVQLPASGWTENDVLVAVQKSLPAFDVQWESPAAAPSPQPE